MSYKYLKQSNIATAGEAIIDGLEFRCIHSRDKVTMAQCYSENCSSLCKQIIWFLYGSIKMEIEEMMINASGCGSDNPENACYKVIAV